MTPATQTTYASGALIPPAASLAASASAAVIYVGVCVVAALYVTDGGFEVLAATLIGAAVGARTADRSTARFELIASYSYAGMWAGLMLAALLHEPLARLARLAVSALLL